MKKAALWGGFLFCIINYAPEVPACNRGVSAPILREFFHLCRGRLFFELVDHLETPTYREVTGGKYVGAAKRENKKHVRGPDAHTLDSHEMLDDFGARHPGEAVRVDFFFRESFCEVFDVCNFLSGESRGTQLRSRRREDKRRCGAIARI